MSRADHSQLLGVGQLVQLSDAKGRKHTVTLETGKRFFTHKGAIAHDDLLGRTEGITVTTDKGTPYLVLRSAALRLHPVDAARRAGGLPEGRGRHRRDGRHLPRRAGARGRSGFRRPVVLPVAGHRADRRAVLVRTAAGVRRRRPQERPHLLR